MLAMSTLLQTRAVTRGRPQQRAPIGRSLAPGAEIQRSHAVGLAFRRPRTADHQREPGPLLAGVDEGLLERPADDIARDGPTQVPEAPRQRQRPCLLRGEV